MNSLGLFSNTTLGKQSPSKEVGYPLDCLNKGIVWYLEVVIGLEIRSIGIIHTGVLVNEGTVLIVYWEFLGPHKEHML